MSNRPPGCCGYLQICSENCGFYEQVESRRARATATPITEYLPGDPQPTGPVAPEPEDAFRKDMHTRKPRKRRNAKKIAPQIWAGTAPGIDPGRIRLYMDADVYEEVIASITPSNARALGINLQIMADFIEKHKK